MTLIYQIFIFDMFDESFLWAVWMETKWIDYELIIQKI